MATMGWSWDAAPRRAWRAVAPFLRQRFNRGYCPICARRTTFLIEAVWLRDNYRCAGCRSIPRWRAVIHVLERDFPGWRGFRIHESSPSGAASEKIARECADYVGSQFFPGRPTGVEYEGVRCEDLEALSFEDESFDLVVTQDVLEHILRPERALAEIARTLKPGGAHLFTVPIYKGRETFIRAAAGAGGVEYLAEKQYHGNPVDAAGSLVTREWGDDLPEFIFRHGGMTTTIHTIRDRRLGLDGEFLEVCVSRKPRRAA